LPVEPVARRVQILLLIVVQRFVVDAVQHLLRLAIVAAKQQRVGLFELGFGDLSGVGGIGLLHERRQFAGFRGGGLGLLFDVRAVIRRLSQRSGERGAAAVFDQAG